MSHHLRYLGIESPQTRKIGFENVPLAEELTAMNWTPVDGIVLSLRARYQGTPHANITAMTVFKALETLKGERMLWVSALEYCIYGRHLPQYMAVTIFIPKADAELVTAIIVCNALVDRLQVEPCFIPKDEDHLPHREAPIALNRPPSISSP